MYSTFKLMKPLEEEKEYGLGKHLVDFISSPGCGKRLMVMKSVSHIRQARYNGCHGEGLFDFPAGVDVVHIGIQNDLEHHPGMVRAAPAHSLYNFLKLSRFRLSTRASTIELDHALQYPRQFLDKKALFGWDYKDENVSLS